MKTKILKAKKAANFLPSAENEIFNSIPQSLINRVTSSDLAIIANLINNSYHKGKIAATPKGISGAGDCIYVEKTEKLIPISVLEQIQVTCELLSENIDCTGSAKHSVHFNEVYATEIGKRIDSMEAHNCDMQKIKTHKVVRTSVTKYALDATEKC